MAKKKTEQDPTPEMEKNLAKMVPQMISTAAMGENLSQPVNPGMLPVSAVTLQPPAQTLGRIGFEAYGDHNGPHGPWKTFDGREIPSWASLASGKNNDGTPNTGGPLTCQRWEVAAEAIRSKVMAEDFDTYAALLRRLSRHAGETGANEGAVETLERLIAEAVASRGARKAGGEIEAMMERGHTRLVAVTHVPAEGETFDEGRRYEIWWAETSVDGSKVERQVEVENGAKVNAMPWHVAMDWLWKRVEMWLKPERFR